MLHADGKKVMNLKYGREIFFRQHEKLIYRKANEIGLGADFLERCGVFLIESF